MTFEEADRYINCTKTVINDDGQETASYEASMNTKGYYQFKLKSEDVPDQEFILVIRPNVKIGVKMTLHLMSDQKEGLVRLDYNGSHQNPLVWQEGVPEVFKPYAGHQFQNQTHLHQFVENYSLKWALPISDTTIEPKAINNADNKAGWQEATDGFCKYLNIQGKVTLK